MNKYVTFLRGINVGGHHKVPMAELKKEMEKMGFKNVITLLNSGNIIFDFESGKQKELEEKIECQLLKKFGFPIPTIVVEANQIISLIESNPFGTIELTKDIRLYISFLKTKIDIDLILPWESADSAYKILEQRNNIVASVLDISVTKTIKGMDILEKKYGKEITTRNWNTIMRIEKKLSQ